MNGHDVSHLQIAVPLLGALGAEECSVAVQPLCEGTETALCMSVHCSIDVSVYV